METLGKLFGSEDKVKIMRLFLFNPGATFTPEMVAGRVKVALSRARRELGVLKQMKLIRPKPLFVKPAKGKQGRVGKSSRRVSGFILNPSFPYLHELQRLLLDASLLKGNEIVKKLSPAGKLKLVIIAGIFIQNTESRLDILVVGDNLKRSTVEHKMRAMESEVGKELRYAAFETSEFNYRLGLYDKLIRDVLDYPHTIVFDRLGLPPLSPGGR